MLFARADDEVIVVVVAVCSAIMLVAGLAIQFLFLLTLKRALEQCAPRNRTMEPGMVFLNLIPCFGAVWMFITVSRVSESLRAEYDDRGMDAYGDYGQQIGISYASLILAWIIPYIGLLFFIGGFVCWILYWVKIAELSRTLREGESYSEEYRDYTRRRREEQRGYERDDEYEDDDRPSRRGRPRDGDYDDRPSRRGRPPEDDDYDDRPHRRRDDY
jgi:hypothetical protein